MNTSALSVILSHQFFTHSQAGLLVLQNYIENFSKYIDWFPSANDPWMVCLFQWQVSRGNQLFLPESLFDPARKIFMSLANAVPLTPLQSVRHRLTIFLGPKYAAYLGCLILQKIPKIEIMPICGECVIFGKKIGI